MEAPSTDSPEDPTSPHAPRSVLNSRIESLSQEFDRMRRGRSALRSAEYYLELVQVSPSDQMVAALDEILDRHARVNVSQRELLNAGLAAMRDKLRAGDARLLGPGERELLPGEGAGGFSFMSAEPDGNVYAITLYPGEFADVDVLADDYERNASDFLIELEAFIYRSKNGK